MNFVGATKKAAYWGPGDRYSVMVTGRESQGSCFIIECLVPPGGGPPMHIHTREEEMFYLLEGNIEVTIGGQTTAGAPGCFYHIPRGIAHTYTNVGDSVAKMLAVFTPAGMEGWFEEALDPAPEDGRLGPPASPEMLQRMLAAGPKHGVVWCDR